MNSCSCLDDFDQFTFPDGGTDTQGVDGDSTDVPGADTPAADIIADRASDAPMDVPPVDAGTTFDFEIVRTLTANLPYNSGRGKITGFVAIPMPARGPGFAVLLADFTGLPAPGFGVYAVEADTADIRHLQTTNAQTRILEVGDVNGDGAQDLFASANSFQEYFVSDGTQALGFRSYTSGEGQTDAMVVFDGNEDGFDDFVGVSFAREEMAVWCNDTDDGCPGSCAGEGCFVQARTKSIEPIELIGNQFAATGDFNGDGAADFVTSISSLAGMGASVGLVTFQNPSLGRFFLTDEQVRLEPPASVEITTVATVVVADFNGDEAADIAVSASDRLDREPILLSWLGTEEGTFTGPSLNREPASRSGTSFMAAFDLNGDGRDDLVRCPNVLAPSLRAERGAEVDIFLGEPDGSLSLISSFPLPVEGDLPWVCSGIAVDRFEGDAFPTVGLALYLPNEAFTMQTIRVLMHQLRPVNR